MAADAAGSGEEQQKSTQAAEAAVQTPAESDPAETEAEEDADEASESEADEADDKDNDSESDKPKKKSGSQRRKERAERAEAEVSRLQKLIEDMALNGAGKSKNEKPEPEPKASPAGKPNIDDFETHAEYVEALTDWKTDQKFKARDEEAEKSKLQSEQQKAEAAHFERINAFANEHDDYNEVLKGVGHLPVSSAFNAEIVESENGPAIIYELAQDPEEFARVALLPVRAVAREIGRIEARILAKTSAQETKPEAKKITKAPKPITPVGGSGKAGAKSLTDPNLTQAEYEAIRREQMKRRAPGW